MAAILIGKEVGELADELVAYGAERVYLAEDSRLELYQSEAYAEILAGLIREGPPEVVLVGATSIGTDLAARVAAKVGTGLTAHCIDLYIEDIEGRPVLTQIVPGWGGNLAVKIVCPRHRPQMATVKAGVLEKPTRDDERRGEIVSLVPRLGEESFRARSVALVEEEGEEETPLEEAERIVAVGWGMNSVGGIQPARDLAELLHAVLAGTRPVVDKGWLPDTRMIGQSGKTVRPKLFVSLGASGAMHFTTGFSKAKLVLAVDQNRQAPIFEVCDLGIVGNLQKILPCLLDEIRSAEATQPQH